MKSFLLAFLLLSSPAFAETKLTEADLAASCVGMFSGILKTVYENEKKFQTPVFDAETDKKILDEFAKYLGDKSEANASGFAAEVTPIFRARMKDTMEVCLGVMKIKYEICKDKFFDPTCDPKFSTREDERVLFASLQEKISAQFMRPRTSEPAAEKAEEKEDSTNSVLWAGHDPFLVIALVWVVLGIGTVCYFTYRKKP